MLIGFVVNVRAAEAAADIQQVWANCAAFNEDGSSMFEAGAAGEAELSGLFVAAGLPTPADALSAATAGGGGGGRGGHSSKKPSRGEHQQPQHHDTAEDHAAADMLAALGSPRQQEAEVTAPRQRKRRREEAADEGLTSDDGGGTKRQRQAAGDAAVVPTTAAAATAAAAAATAAHYAAGQPAAATANEPLSGKQAAAACKAVLAVVAQPAGAVFAAPVGKEAPGYRREIKRPMDLGTISQRLQQGAYKTPGAHSFELRLLRVLRRSGHGIPSRMSFQQVRSGSGWRGPSGHILTPWLSGYIWLSGYMESRVVPSLVT